MLSRGRAIPIPVRIQCHPIMHFCKRLRRAPRSCGWGDGPWRAYYLRHRTFMVLPEAGRGWFGASEFRDRPFMAPQNDARARSVFPARASLSTHELREGADYDV